jgi:RNA polymerase sigma-70 factor (ECF subfamily)
MFSASVSILSQLGLPSRADAPARGRAARPAGRPGQAAEVSPVPRAAPQSSVLAASEEQAAAEGEAGREADRAAELACIAAVQAGDVQAFGRLVEVHQARVYTLALRMLGNEAEAQDAAQDAFVQAYTRLSSYRPEWRFKTWIMAITSHLCIDRLRRRRLEPSTFADQPDPDAEFVSREPQPDVAVAAGEQRDVLRRMLASLSPEDRSMLAMFYWGDLSYEEIAQALRTTVPAVKSRLFRARRALAQSPLAARLQAG